jgi:NADPH-dependent 2,4-dienoyl-CoA reductase/sulfur reductase-like enzyme
LRRREEIMPYDLAIIGSGGAAFAAAITARDAGASVVMIGRCWPPPRPGMPPPTGGSRGSPRRRARRTWPHWPAARTTW